MYFVRTAGEGDLQKVRALLVESFHATYDDLHGKTKVDELIADLFTPAALKARLARKDAEFLVADDGRKIGGVGYAAMSQALTKTVMLHLLYVSPALQRQGIGRDIFAELENVLSRGRNHASRSGAAECDGDRLLSGARLHRSWPQ
ncbi:GNAT superfamily N-acetyltransferase [Rhizobium lentis]|uniref:GNAT superfamily N-acetyltransferase n=1 Tax=Rhizobium lentis TaxID=1138194 RepID=A0A7W8UMJ6_9HYPH|nr:GNAT superfamily N-acetyltransferase [Rhizobium lentis]MBB5550225.1 GNAT superfamily N-acetyltransferase [Rhizobium lentis]MBB5560746.1 GNAT superfamily N-acetyltransferase [Rhizobium lentis]MBB5567332.1 GNAT superfamily N-acetyltransferase [Rhizobium lentis]